MPKKLNLLGEKFGKLTVISQVENQGKRTRWLCKCDCGKEKICLTDSLRSGRCSSCGCLRSENAKKQSKNNIKSLLGQTFGLLTVIEQAESIRGHSAWKYQCSCGKDKIVCSIDLKNGSTLSCGCLKSSFGEKRIEEILIENNIDFKKEYIFPNLLSTKNIPLRFDFAIFKNNSLFCLIEYDGEQHYLNNVNNFWNNDSLIARKERDKIKNDYCLKNNIKLIRIPYWEKNNISLELLFSNKYLIT